MGSYYKPVIADTKTFVTKTFNPHDYDNGYKLMEHSYLENYFMSTIMNQLAEPAEYIHLCDYHEPDRIYENTWDDLPDDSKPEENNNHPGFIMNHTNKSFIDFIELKKLYKEKSIEWPIHPIPILCNSEEQSSGGGDYHPVDSRRSTWASNTLQVTNEFIDIPADYKNVTKDCLFFE